LGDVTDEYTRITLVYEGNKVAVVDIDSVYSIDPEDVCLRMFQTTSREHPGVAMIFSEAHKKCVSGSIKVWDVPELGIPHSEVPKITGTVFQSRNPPHKAHEAIVNKYAPEVLYTTPYSTVNKNDYPFSMKIKAYEVIKEKYDVDIYVSTLPRVFAGPREALQNCLVFQNMGASKIVMGRGKNCVKDFYKDDASYSLCKRMYDNGLITIEPVWENTIYTEGIEIKASHIKRDYVNKGLVPPENMMSSYISELLCLS
jgi:ATP sulfurylase